MKTLCIFGLFCFGLVAHSESIGAAEIAQIDRLYIPHGFDDNDIVEVVIFGHFSDSCHQLGEAEVKFSDNRQKVTVTPISYKEEGVSCVQMISPYVQAIKLGRMFKGQYEFNVTNNPQANERLFVKEAQVSARDDFMYPPVDYAEVKNNPNGGSVLTLKGRYPKLKQGCMKTTSAMLHFQDGDMLVIQPKAKIINKLDERGCEAQYESNFQLPYTLNGKVLLHVRTVNGQSYNRVEEVN